MTQLLLETAREHADGARLARERGLIREEEVSGFFQLTGSPSLVQA
jgi:hypothetical protein